jgi:aspartate-semialdehyde dehydrogenase
LERTRLWVDDERKEFIDLWRKWHGRIMALPLIIQGNIEAVTRYEETQLEETPLEDDDKELKRLMVPRVKKGRHRHRLLDGATVAHQQRVGGATAAGSFHLPVRG